MTTGKRYIARNKGKGTARLIDARTKSVLEEIQRTPRGKALDAYLMAFGSKLDRC